MIIVTVDSHFIGRTITPDGLVFKTAERCVKNIPNVRKQLEVKHSEVYIECQARDFNE